MEDSGGRERRRLMQWFRVNDHVWGSNIILCLNIILMWTKLENVLIIFNLMIIFKWHEHGSVLGMKFTSKRRKNERKKCFAKKESKCSWCAMHCKKVIFVLTLRQMWNTCAWNTDVSYTQRPNMTASISQHLPAQMLFACILSTYISKLASILICIYSL